LRHPSTGLDLPGWPGGHAFAVGEIFKRSFEEAGFGDRVQGTGLEPVADDARRDDAQLVVIDAALGGLGEEREFDLAEVLSLCISHLVTFALDI
jgi:hypothetical protein